MESLKLGSEWKGGWESMRLSTSRERSRNCRAQWSICGRSVRKPGKHTSSSYFSQGHALQLGVFLSLQWNFRVIQKQQTCEAKWSSFCMPKIQALKHVRALTFEEQLHQIFSRQTVKWEFFFGWSTHNFIWSDKIFHQLEILITKIQVFFSSLTSVSCSFEHSITLLNSATQKTQGQGDGWMPGMTGHGSVLSIAWPSGLYSSAGRPSTPNQSQANKN